MADDMNNGGSGAIPVGGIYASVVIDTNDAPAVLDQLKTKAASAAVAIDGMAAATQKASTGMARGTDASGRFRQGLIQVAYAMDDVQYGLGALQNNVVPIITSFGGSGPLALGLIAVAAGGMLAYNAFNAISKSMADAYRKVDPLRNDLDKLKDKFDELEKKVNPDIFDRLEMQSLRVDIDAATEALKRYQAIRDGKSDAKSKSDTAINKVFTEDDENRKALRKTVGADVVANDGEIAQLRADIAEAEKTIATETDGLLRALAQDTKARAALAIDARTNALGRKDGEIDQRVGEIVNGDNETLAKTMERAGRPDAAAKIRANSEDAMRSKDFHAADQEGEEAALQRQHDADEKARSDKAKDKAAVKRAAAELERRTNEDIRQEELNERDEKKEDTAEARAAGKVATRFGAGRRMAGLVRQAKGGNVVALKANIRDQVAMDNPEVEAAVLDRAAEIIADRAIAKGEREHAIGANVRPDGAGRRATNVRALPKMKGGPANAPLAPLPKFEMPKLDPGGATPVASIDKEAADSLRTIAREVTETRKLMMS